MVLAGGSPCQQLALMGQHAGQLGLCGRDSVNFFVFPALAWTIQQRRPDLHVHVMVESARTIVDIHSGGMARALGIPIESGKAPIIYAGRWTVFPRKRIFLSTLPWKEPAKWPDMRPPPWDPGWGARGMGQMATMLRARNREGEPLRALAHK